MHESRSSETRWKEWILSESARSESTRSRSQRHGDARLENPDVDPSLADQVGVAERRHTLNDGKKLPQIGMGTYPLDDAAAEVAVYEAANRGFRLFDTAVNYENETGVGRGIALAGLPRDQVFVATKIPGRDQGGEALVRSSLEGSLHRLGLDHVDLYLIHWPNPKRDKYVETYRTMLKLRDEGLVGSVGVSNFTPAHVDRLIEQTGEAPAVNQVELNPQYQQEALRAHHHEQRILIQAWAPLGRKTEILQHEWLAEIAGQVNRTPAQVALRWEVQSGILPIPKSANPKRMAENLDVFSWELDDQQMERIRLLHTGLSGSGFDPDEHEEM